MAVIRGYAIFIVLLAFHLGVCSGGREIRHGFEESPKGELVDQLELACVPCQPRVLR